jgi:hypothetical protein
MRGLRFLLPVAPWRDGHAGHSAPRSGDARCDESVE